MTLSNTVLDKLSQKIRDNQYLTLEEGLSLYDAPLWYLGQLAGEIKHKRYGDHITFIRNYYLNFTNVCKYACKYCGFRRHKDDPDAYTLTLEDIQQRLENSPEKLQEVWFSSGLNAALPFQYYIDLLQTVKKAAPGALIKAFTAVEVDFFAKHYDMSHEEVVDKLVEAGLDRIPGGGAEIFDLKIRKKIDMKTRPEDYLKIHRLFHQKDIPTSMTMLFGHVEERIHRIDHMIKIREFQEESGGMQAFIPLAFNDSNNPLAKRGVKGPHAVEILKTLAISRIMLNNVDHVQSYWVNVGGDVTKVALHFGVDDLNGTLVEENIMHESGSEQKRYESSDNLINWIQGAGLIAAERDCRFNTIKVIEN